MDLQKRRRVLRRLFCLFPVTAQQQSAIKICCTELFEKKDRYTVLYTDLTRNDLQNGEKDDIIQPRCHLLMRPKGGSVNGGEEKE